jgi:hypothetical protein
MGATRQKKKNSSSLQMQAKRQSKEKAIEKLLWHFVQPSAAEERESLCITHDRWRPPPQLIAVQS